MRLPLSVSNCGWTWPTWQGAHVANLMPSNTSCMDLQRTWSRTILSCMWPISKMHKNDRIWYTQKCQLAKRGYKSRASREPSNCMCHTTWSINEHSIPWRLPPQSFPGPPSWLDPWICLEGLGWGDKDGYGSTGFQKTRHEKPRGKTKVYQSCEGKLPWKVHLTAKMHSTTTRSTVIWTM